METKATERAVADTARPTTADQGDVAQRARYACGHLEAIARMSADGRDSGELLRQARAARRAVESLEARCLVLYLVDTGQLPAEMVRKVTELYRLANR